MGIRILRFGYFLLGFVLLPNFALSQGASTVGEPVLSVQKLDVRAGMQAPQLLVEPQPEFPEEARQRGIDGKCMMTLVVDLNGMPRDVHVVRSSDPVFAPICGQSILKSRFKPAAAVDGSVVAVQMTFVMSFHRDGYLQPGNPVRYGFSSPPGVLSNTPDTNGVYMLTQVVSVPTMNKFVDKGYGDLGFKTEGNSPCDVVLTVGVNGKPSDVRVVKCEREELEAPVVQSLLASKYKPGSVGGKPVAVRARMHVEYGEFTGK